MATPEHRQNGAQTPTRTSSAFRSSTALLAAVAVLLAFHSVSPTGVASIAAWASAVAVGALVFACADTLIALFIVALPPALLVGSLVYLTMRRTIAG